MRYRTFAEKINEIETSHMEKTLHVEVDGHQLKVVYYDHLNSLKKTVLGWIHLGTGESWIRTDLIDRPALIKIAQAQAAMKRETQQEEKQDNGRFDNLESE